MHIAYDAAPLVGHQRSGVGFAEADAILNLSRSHPESRFSLLYFSLRTPKKKRARLAPYLLKNVDLVPCPFFMGRYYRAINGFLPLPFSLFFPRRADVTHFFDSLIPPGVRGKTVVSVPDTAYLYHPDSVPKFRRLFLKWNMRSSLSRASLIVTESEFMRRELCEYYALPENKVRVIRPGIDSARFRADLDPAKIAHVRETYGIGENYILYMGAIEPRKNLSRLLNAYSALVKRMKEDAPALVLAGRRGGANEHLEKKVARLGLKRRVHFCGYVAEKDKPYLLAGSRCFAFPSLSEGTGAAVLEAMACGVPVLASGGSALEEVCGSAALLVDPYKTDEIGQGLQRLLTDPALRETCIRAGLERAADRAFSRTENAERLYELYRELCP